MVAPNQPERPIPLSPKELRPEELASIEQAKGRKGSPRTLPRRTQKPAPAQVRLDGPRDRPAIEAPLVEDAAGKLVVFVRVHRRSGRPEWRRLAPCEPARPLDPRGETALDPSEQREHVAGQSAAVTADLEGLVLRDAYVEGSALITMHWTSAEDAPAVALFDYEAEGPSEAVRVSEPELERPEGGVHGYREISSRRSAFLNARISDSYSERMPECSSVVFGVIASMPCNDSILCPR